METFPALSVRQPWADLIVDGIKDVENRTWSTDFRGRLLVHAPSTVDRAAVERVYRDLGLALPEGYDPVTGALLGWTEVVDCVTRHPSRFFAGPYGFVLRHPQRLPRPIPWPGRLGIFRVPASVLEQESAAPRRPSAGV